MSSSRALRRALVVTLALACVVLLLAVAYTTNAILRPGCSLLPVAVPDDGSGRSQPISLEQACAVLGRPLPAAALPDGVGLTALSATTGAPAGALRMVRIAYSKAGRNVATLDIARTGPPAENLRANNTVGTTPADVQVTHVQADNFDDVSYHWFRDDLAYTLHVALVAGITRNAADDMAASIR